MTDPQLSLIVTDRINPRDQVRLMPGTDAVCEQLSERDKPEMRQARDRSDELQAHTSQSQANSSKALAALSPARSENCLWPFCPCFAPPTKQEED